MLSDAAWNTVEEPETGPRCYHLKPPHSEPTWASYDPVHQRVLGYGEDAWRSVGYVVHDETGMPMWLPIEAFADNGELDQTGQDAR